LENGGLEFLAYVWKWENEFGISALNWKIFQLYTEMSAICQQQWRIPTSKALRLVSYCVKKNKIKTCKVFWKGRAM
jgi:hypothetical protein